MKAVKGASAGQVYRRQKALLRGKELKVCVGGGWDENIIFLPTVRTTYLTLAFVG